jgi:hypothetical protein
MRSAHNDVDQFSSFHENRPREIPHFACVPTDNDICSSPVKPYDILTVKNALVKSVCCVRRRTIYSPVPVSIPTFSCFRFTRTNLRSLSAVCPQHQLPNSTVGFRLIRSTFCRGFIVICVGFAGLVEAFERKSVVSDLQISFPQSGDREKFYSSFIRYIFYGRICVDATNILPA